MSSLQYIECPCGCGETTAEDSDMGIAWRWYWPCEHKEAKETAASGVWYCRDCWHWLGSPAAFQALPVPPADKTLWIFLDGDSVGGIS